MTKDWVSVSILEIIFGTRGLAQKARLSKMLMDMHRSQGMEGSVRWHKKRLGRQLKTWQGSDRRFWIWEGQNWRVYASNGGGTSLEIRAGLSHRESVKAFEDYRKETGLARV